MVSSEGFTMVKYNCRSKAAACFSDGLLYVSVAFLAFLMVCAFWSFLSPGPAPHFSTKQFSDDRTSVPVSPSVACGAGSGPNMEYDTPDENFYDDPRLTYTIDSPRVRNWDEKRREWLRQHPSFIPGAEDRVLMVTGSQATPCKNPIGDHLLLRLFKNKVDYGRRHGIDVFYNTALLQPKMFSFWAKTPAVKAAMLAHPEAEWIWWVDADAAITDMDFRIPLGRYKDHNMVVHGWPRLINEKKSWTGLNAGVFLIRNNQWAMDLMDAWARMGPQSPDYNKWGRILRSTFRDKIFPESDDQSGLAYLILKDKEKWGSKIYLEGEYYFEGYWMEIVENFNNISKRYSEIEREVALLRRRHAEKVSESYSLVWEEELTARGAGNGGRESWRRPFITHFTGCQPCSGNHNQMYSGRACIDAMQTALTFADNQVLRNYGFMHRHTQDPFAVKPLPFDYPAASSL